MVGLGLGLSKGGLGTSSSRLLKSRKVGLAVGGEEESSKENKGSGK